MISSGLANVRLLRSNLVWSRTFWWINLTGSHTSDSSDNFIELSKPTPKESYIELCNRGLYKSDFVQLRALTELDELQRKIVKKGNLTTKGIYLYGGVGRGKTMLMDLFYTSLDHQNKTRLHFHAWMLEIHSLLHSFRGQKDPLASVAAAVAKKSRIICLDEFEITDVADAFVLRWLFERLWGTHNVVAVFTSNAVPDSLYMGGINRSSFLPFVALLKSQCQVISLDAADADADASIRSTSSAGGHRGDYRILTPPLHGRLYCCHVEDFERSWSLLLGGRAVQKDAKVNVGSGSRVVSVPLSCGGMCRYTFQDLCGGGSARGAADYLSLSTKFSCLALEGVPRLGGRAGDDEARRFITLVDVWYESRGLLLLLVDGEVMPHDLFLWDREEDKLDDVKAALGAEGGEGDAEGDTEVPGASPLSSPRPGDGSEEEEDRLWVAEEGGSSGRHVTMLRGLDGGEAMEWSGTGRPGVSLAQQAASAGDGASFTQKASSRTVSRLLQMTGAEWLEAWARAQGREGCLVTSSTATPKH